MSALVPVINGSGKPRLILVQTALFYQSTGTTTFTASQVTEAEGSTVAISTSQVGNPGIINATAHGRSQDDWINIAGHSGSTPSINGKWRVLQVVTANQLRIGVNITVGGSVGTLRRTPAFSGRGLSVNRRIAIEPTGSGRLIYGKIISIDDTSNILGIDSWFGGMPANGLPFKVDGWIADLPYCDDLTETFTPDELVHPLWRGRKSSKHYGFAYSCSLSYAKGIFGDTLLLLAPHMNMQRTDRLVLIPHIDKPEFNYNVFFSQAFDLSQFGQGLAHIKPVLRFDAKENVQYFPIAGGYGTNYANNYGIGL